jgi:hypothetical protein
MTRLWTQKSFATSWLGTSKVPVTLPRVMLRQVEELEFVLLQAARVLQTW